MEPMLLSEIYRLFGYSLNRPDVPVKGISTDSRTLRAGEVFIPLKGGNFDGHRFIPGALEAGAVCVFSSEKETAAPSPHIVSVEDTLVAYHKIASHYRDRFRIPVIAVTGSNGKTTTKDLLAALLGGRYRTLATPANNNNEIGVPRTVLELDAGYEALVLEFGMRGAGQIRQLREMVKPTVGVITMIGEAHYELLGSYEAIARAKGELIEEFTDRETAILNGDDRWTGFLSGRTGGRVLTFGSGKSDTLRLLEKSRTPGGYEITVGYGGKSYGFYLPFIGLHNISNALAALLAGFLLEVPCEAMREALAGASVTGKRMQRQTAADGTLVVNDSYNASPSSMELALKTLMEFPAACGRVVVVGDMRELGALSESAHRQVGALIAALSPDYAAAVGPLSRWTAEEAVRRGMPPERCRHFENRDDSLGFLDEAVRPGSTVLVKASRLLELERLAEYIIKQHGGHRR